jgi:uncharacterized membrane protein YqiK
MHASAHIYIDYSMFYCNLMITFNFRISQFNDLKKKFLFLPGGCCGSQRKRTIVGGWAWAWWLVTDVQKLSLEVMTLNPMCEMVETAQGVALTVTGVAQVKIMKVIF